MLETRFPRVPGDIGHPASFDHPVEYLVVRGASPRRVVAERAQGLLEPFVEAARSLEARGCQAITTSCGFLALFQDTLAAAVRVPLATSSLTLLPAIERSLPPGRHAGVVTISARSLTPDHLRGAGARQDTPVVGVRPDGEFVRAILGDLPDMDTSRLEAEVIAAGSALRDAHPGLSAIVLECTNMPPYAAALEAAVGLPVHDVLTLARRLMA
jgi:Asp/Glu/hydantoin racemase